MKFGFGIDESYMGFVPFFLVSVNMGLLYLMNCYGFFFFFGVILELFVQFSKFKFLIVLDDDDERFVVGDSLILKRSWSGDDPFVCYLFIYFFVKLV